MRLNKLKLSCVFLLGFGLTGLQAQTMYVKESSGTQTAYTLSNIQKMSFSSGNLTVTKTDNNNEMFALSGLRYLNFSDISLVHELQLEKLIVYPNPVFDKLNINIREIAKTGGTLSILNLDGKTMLSREVNIEGVLSIDISHLPASIYLCRYSTDKKIKIVKIIKQ